MAESRRVPIAAMLAFTRDALLAHGVPAADAELAARQMIEADITGFDAHGIMRLNNYCNWIKSGRVNPKANIKVLQRSPATALVDGNDGIGHLVMTYAMNLAIELARTSGVGWVGARNSNHAGAAGIYPAMAADQGMVGIYAAVSTMNHMALWGGAEALLGTNPIAIAVPAGKEAPVVLDIATSVASNGAIRSYALEGKPMPEGWVISRADGQPITDGRRLDEGMFVPIGGYKGSGLAIVLGLLGGPLNRAAFGRDVKDVNAEQVRETNTGQFVIALDVARFVAPNVFAAEVDRHVRDLASSKRLPVVDEIRIPGQGRLARRTDRQINGVPLAPSLLKQLDEIAKSLAIAPLTARA